MQVASLSGIGALVRLLGRYRSLDQRDLEALSVIEELPILDKCPQTGTVREGDNPTVIRLLVSGWAFRYKDLPDGRRQIVGFILPGEFRDLNVYILSQLDHSIDALTHVRYFEIPPQQFQSITDVRPQLTSALLWLEMVNSGIERAWLLSIGQRSPVERFAHLFVELHQRLNVIGLVDRNSFEFPVTKHQLAGANGISPAHVNRTLQEMRRDGLVELADRELRILDLDRLKRVSMFNNNYLHFTRE